MTKTPRHRAREFALQGLYQWQLGNQDEAAIVAQAAEAAGFNKADHPFYRDLLQRTLADSEALAAAIAPHLDRAWKDVSPVERSILLLAACELRHFPETPYRVVLNEAIELAKSYGGAEGHKFVNGVLDKLAADLRPWERKSGA